VWNRAEISTYTKSELTFVIEPKRINFIVKSFQNRMSSSTFHKLYTFSFERNMTLKWIFDFTFAWFTVSALAIFVATKADDFILVHDLVKQNKSCMFETTTYLYYLWLLTIYSFNSSWYSQELFRFFAWLNLRLDVNTSLEICWCSPTVNLVAFIDGKTVSSTCSDVNDFEIF